ncbi:MAG: DUF4837 family protein [bacterium]|nr:DUF4837 family protein [bacterium]
MKFVVRLATLLILPVLFLSSGCGLNNEKGILMAAGSYSDLAVVVSSPNIEPLARKFLQGLNTKKTFVIKEEGLFNPDVLPANKLDIAKGYKNAILILRIGDGGKLEKSVRKQVSDETWNRLRSGSGGLVQLNDPWATYQTVLVVASRDRNSLSSLLGQKTEKIRSLFEKSSRKRLQRRNRYNGLNTALMNAYRDRFGFSLEIPKDFSQNQLEPDGFPGLELLQSAPSRGVSISWLATEDVSWLMTQRAALAVMRQNMGEKLHTEDVIAETFQWSEEKLGEHDVLKLEGAWTSQRFAGGGAFWCYFIPDPKNNRVICLDLLVYAPGMDKLAMFRALDAIAGTFSLADR